MTFALSNAAFPAYEVALTALSTLLDKAEAFATAKKIDAAVLLQARLAPDMFALTRQVQIACDMTKNGLARLAGVKPPVFEDKETTIAELKARIASTLAFIRTLDRAAIDAATARDITFPIGREKTARMKGADYLTMFISNNFYFHVTTAYDILRHNGVEVGKMDFLGAIPIAWD